VIRAVLFKPGLNLKKSKPMVSYSVKLRCNTSKIQKNGTAALYLIVIINRETKFVPLNLVWPPEYVDNKKGVMSPRMKKDPDFNDYQLIISNELQKINEIFKVYRIQDKLLTMELFTEELANIDRRRDFIAYMVDKIADRYKYKDISKRTQLNHSGSLNRLKKFKKHLPFYAIDKKLLIRFSAWLKKEYGNEDGTIWGRIKDIKTYLHLAREEGISINEDIDNFENTPPLPSILYLEESELNRLMGLYNSNRLELTDQQTLRAFLFSCFTSLRISDVFLAERGWINLNNELQFIPHKNRRFKKEVFIPLSEIAKSFIEKPFGKFFNLPSEQEMNRSLKDIAKECKILKNLTFHVSRHTFGTQFYKQTKDLAALQKIMGHSKITTTMIYVHINDKDKRTGMDLMSEAFKKNPGFLRLIANDKRNKM
jgi:integrase/recombinase XerD